MHTKTIGSYKVQSDVCGREISKLSQVAFAVNHDNSTVIIDRSGHGTMIRKYGFDRSDFEGGWIFPRKNKITYYSGTLGHVSHDQDAVTDVISNYLRVFLSAA